MLPDDRPARPVGVARLIRYPGEQATADVAVSVLDSWQGRGAGRALLAAVLSRRPAGVTRLRTTVAADNDASLALLAGAGTVAVGREGGGVHRRSDRLTASFLTVRDSVQPGRCVPGCRRNDAPTSYFCTAVATLARRRG